jgi:hypothetical protein
LKDDAKGSVSDRLQARIGNISVFARVAVAGGNRISLFGIDVCASDGAG